MNWKFWPSRGWNHEAGEKKNDIFSSKKDEYENEWIK